MRDLVIVFIHLFSTLARLAKPGGVRSVLAESLLVKHQLPILRRCRHRASNFRFSDRILSGWCALFVRPSRRIRSADLENKLLDFKTYFNNYRSHTARDGQPPDAAPPRQVANLRSYRWESHCRGLYQTPIVA